MCLKQVYIELKQGNSYSIAFEKIVFVENDPSKNCINYPNISYKSYKDCDDAFIHDAYNSFNQMNPVWAPDLFRKNLSRNYFVQNAIVPPSSVLVARAEFIKPPISSLIADLEELWDFGCDWEWSNLFRLAL